MLWLDCETRSELDINDVGAYRYLSHYSTWLLMIAYAFGNEDIKIWECHKGPMPEDLRRGLEDPFEIIIAWNCNFERLAFRNLLKMEIPIDRFEDAMVRARYMSLPGSLDKVGKILDISSKKLKEFFIKDQSMVSLFSLPLRYGGEITLFGQEPTTYRDWDTHPKEWAKFCEYCIVDVEAMREIMNRVSKFPLPESEYKFFEISEEINDRGIYTDSVLLQGSMLIVEKEQGALYKEWFDLTGIKKPKSTKQVLGFAKLHGFTFPSIGKPFIKRALAGECQLDEIGTKALNLRLQLSKSSVSKLEACQDSVEPDGRVRGLFNFMGAARTGRWTSGLFQAHNLVKATREIEAKQDLALELVKAGDYERIKKEFSSPIDVACSTLRPILRAPKGRKFIIADLNAIETRGAAWIAGCDTLMEVFRLGRCPYITFAAQMDPSKTYEELYADYKAGNKKARTDAKSPTLGCFGQHTLVITSSGLKAITKITEEDYLWDGEEWVKSDGVIYQGHKETIDLSGVRVTEDHKILTNEGEWRRAWELVNTLHEKKAIRLATGSFKKESFAQSQTEKNFTIYANVPADSRVGSTSRILNQVKHIVVTGVLEREQSKKETEFIRDLMLLEKSLIDLRIDIMQSYLDVGVSESLLTAIKDVGLSVNSQTYTTSWSTACLSQITINLTIKLIEQIIMGIMKKTTYDLLPVELMEEIKKHLDLLNTKEKDCLPWNFTRGIALYIEKLEQFVEKLEADFLPNRLLQTSHGAVEPTYDIKNCGPRNRYTIMTQKGPMIVHNCGYGLTAGTIERDNEGNLVKTGLLAYADNMGIELTEEYAQQAVLVYRNSYPEIVNFWWDLHRAFANAVENDATVEIGPLTLEKQGRVLNMWLPSGRALHYIDPKVVRTERTSKKGNKYKATDLFCQGIHQETHQWQEIDTRGAKLFENAVQAICRDVLAEGMINCRDAGFELVLHCHDELVAEADEDSHLTVDTMVECMTRPMSWAPGFVLGAAGFESPYYVKEA